MKRIVFFLLIVAAACEVVYIGLSSARRSHAVSLTTYAKNIVAKCVKFTNHGTCYEDEVPKLIGRITMEDGFEVTAIIQSLDSTYPYCHNMGHKLSFVETRRHKDEWEQVLARCPLAMCNYGCLHGSLIEHFRGEVLTQEQIEESLPVLESVCVKRDGWDPNAIDSSMCFHAIGHVAMYITGADVKKALEVCNRVTSSSQKPEYTQTCMEGIFMTLMYGNDPEDIALTKKIRPTKDTFRAFCSSFDPHVEQACRREASTFFETELQEPSYLRQFCSFATDAEDIRACYHGVINRLTDLFAPKPNAFNRIIAYCRDLPEKRELCYWGFATRLVQTDVKNLDQAVAICAQATQMGKAEGDACWGGLAYYGLFMFHFGTSERQQYCSVLPGVWSKTCSQAK